MGFSISWLAFSGKSRSDVLTALRLEDTGDEEEFPESPLSAASLPDDWTIVFLNKFDHPFAEDASLALLSKGCTLIAAHVEEHVMFSSACCFHEGRMVWSVSHEFERGRFDVQSKGTPPQNFIAIRENMIATQRAEGGENADVDYIFEVPLELAASQCGYKHDRIGPPFSVLRERKETP